MKIYQGFDHLQGFAQPTSWALGFFDGFHRGHQALIHATHALGGSLGLITFQQHPLHVLCPEKAPLLLSPCLDQKVALTEALGVEHLLFLPFDRKLAMMGPRAFLDLLRQNASLHGIAMGSNGHFGQGGQGDAGFLQLYAKQYHIKCHIEQLAQHDEARICSSRIREKLRVGQLAQVADMLGRSFSIYGQVEKGQQLARKLGFPTANIRTAEGAALPPFGVYEIRCHYRGKQLRGLANLGLRPSITEDEKVVRLESHFFDWCGDLYGEMLELELVSYVRKERKFKNLEELQQAIAQDVQFVRG